MGAIRDSHHVARISVTHGWVRPELERSLACLGLAFVNQWPSDALHLFVALIWLVPDRRIERIAD